MRPLLLLFFLLVLAPQKQVTNKQKTQEHIPAKQIQPPEVAQQSPNSASTPVVKFYTNNAQQENNTEPAKIIFDGLLVLLTGGLVWVGVRQANILNRQADILGKHEEWMQKHDANLTNLAKSAKDGAEVSQKNLTATFPPEVIVRSITLKPDKITYIVTNRGGTKAQIMFSNITVTDIDCVGGWLPATPPYSEADNVLGKITLEPGDFKNGEIALEAGILERIRVEIARARGGFPNPGSVYCLGYIQYLDGNMVVRYTAFCRLFNVHRQRFVAVNDSDYEYAD
jgi:hypothetical protein